VRRQVVSLTQAVTAQLDGWVTVPCRLQQPSWAGLVGRKPCSCRERISWVNGNRLTRDGQGPVREEFVLALPDQVTVASRYDCGSGQPVVSLLERSNRSGTGCGHCNRAVPTAELTGAGRRSYYRFRERGRSGLRGDRLAPMVRVPSARSPLLSRSTTLRPFPPGAASGTASQPVVARLDAVSTAGGTGLGH